MPRILGPVFYYDLLRSSRKGRYLLLRCVFVLLLFGILWLSYAAYGELLQAQLQASRVQAVYARQGIWVPPATTMNTSLFGEKFFSWFFVVQFIVIVLITPAMVAGAVAEEKQRQTIEYLFTSNLQNHEIILGKLVSRLLTILMLLAAGLPILSIAQWFGGISWELVLAGFGACLVTVFSLGSLSLYQSVKARRVREALGKAYLMVVLYFVGWGLLLLFQFVMAADEKSGSRAMQVMTRIIDVYNAGNPVTALIRLAEEVQRRGSLGSMPFELLSQYAAFHLVVGMACLIFSMMKIRKLYIQQTYHARMRKAPTKRMEKWYRPVWGKGKSRRHPPLEERDPLAWKERWFERNLRFGPVVQALFVVGMGLLLAPGLIFAIISIMAYSTGHDYFHYSIGWGEYFRFLGAFLFCLAIMGNTIRAAGSIGSEKDRQTWETLLATPVSLRHVYWSKWWASLAAPRWFYWIWLAMIGMAGVTGCLHPLSIPSAILHGLALACFAASLGMWLAARSRGGLQAIIGSVLTLLLITLVAVFLQWLVEEYYRRPYAYSAYPRSQLFLSAAPLIGMGFILQNSESWNRFGNPDLLAMVNDQVGTVLVSVFFYGLLALILFWRGRRALAIRSGRVDDAGQYLELPANHSVASNLQG